MLLHWKRNKDWIGMLHRNGMRKLSKHWSTWCWRLLTRRLARAGCVLPCMYRERPGWCLKGVQKWSGERYCLTHHTAHSPQYFYPRSEALMHGYTINSSRNTSIKEHSIEACSSLQGHHGDQCDSSKEDWSIVLFSALCHMLEMLWVRFSAFEAIYIGVSIKFTQLNSICFGLKLHALEMHSLHHDSRPALIPM